MGWFQRTFGRSENAKIERANYYIERERYADAIRELDDLDASEAIQLRAEATLELLEINLEEAKARFNAGDSVGAKEHIDIALHLGATKDQIKSVRRHVERVKQERMVEEQKKQKKVQDSVDHGDDPIWSLPPDHPKLRYAFRVERYPLELQERLIDLGEEFASAVIQLEDGDPRIAYDRLSAFVPKDDVAYMERARAALQYGDLQRAASDLQEFGSRIGHCVIDNTHTGALLVSLISNLGRVEEALTLVEGMYRKEPHPALEHIRSQLLESHGELRRAEKASAKLLKENPNNLSLIRQLARVRLKLSDRVGAAAVLESGLKRCCTPGNCSSQPFDVDAARMLVQIYLEDREHEHRSEELLKDLAKHVKSPNWSDRYILALKARNKGEPFAADIAKKLLASLSSDDPRTKRVYTSFPDLVPA